MSLGAMSVGLIAIAATVLVGVVVVALLPRAPGLDLPPPPPPAPPTWTLTLPAGQPPATVQQLFNDGVAAMRRRRSSEALRAFYRVLLMENGNRAAERWSFTAGEHLMLDTLELRLDETRADRVARESARDALLERWPRRKVAKELKESFRDDPVVLAKTGWAPSQAEANLARLIDRAFTDANAGRLEQAAASFDEAYQRTRNPALEQRASFGRESVRRELARRVAEDWRRGIDAETRGDAGGARAAFERVLALDPANPSARARLNYLGGAPSVVSTP
jgi:tetratricopeptide (TPR) repeat protein